MDASDSKAATPLAVPQPGRSTSGTGGPDYFLPSAQAAYEHSKSQSPERFPPPSAPSGSRQFLGVSPAWDDPTGTGSTGGSPGSLGRRSGLGSAADSHRASVGHADSGHTLATSGTASPLPVPTYASNTSLLDLYQSSTGTSQQSVPASAEHRPPPDDLPAHMSDDSASVYSNQESVAASSSMAYTNSHQSSAPGAVPPVPALALPATTTADEALPTLTATPTPTTAVPPSPSSAVPALRSQPVQSDLPELQRQLSQLHDRLGAAAASTSSQAQTRPAPEANVTELEWEAAKLTRQLEQMTAHLVHAQVPDESHDRTQTYSSPKHQAPSISSGSEYGSDADTHEEQLTRPPRMRAVANESVEPSTPTPVSKDDDKTHVPEQAQSVPAKGRDSSSTSEQLRVQAALQAEDDARNPNRPRTLQEARARARARAEARRKSPQSRGTGTPDSTRLPRDASPDHKARTMGPPTIALNSFPSSQLDRSSSLGRRPLRSPQRLMESGSHGGSAASTPLVSATALPVPESRPGLSQHSPDTPDRPVLATEGLHRSTSQPIVASPTEEEEIRTPLASPPHQGRAATDTTLTDLNTKALPPIVPPHQPEASMDILGQDKPWPRAFFLVVPLAQQASPNRFFRAASHLAPTARSKVDGHAQAKAASISGPIPSPATLAVAYAEATAELLDTPTGLQTWMRRANQAPRCTC